MTSNLIPFEFESQAVRIIDRTGEPWFVLGDVCRVLDITNVGNVSARLDDDEKGSIHNPDVTSAGGNPNITIINESGLYSLILTSRKPSAKRFKKWVTAEVLPSIRKTGGYGAQPRDERPQVDRIREGRLSYQHHLRMCRLLGITGMPAAIAASRAVKALLGIDMLGSLGITHAPAPGEEPNMSPTTMGKQIGLSAQAVNAALSRHGYQTSFRDAKDRLIYEPTQKGKDAGGRMLDTGKRHDSGAPVTQLMWSSKTLAALKADLEMERA